MFYSFLVLLDVKAHPFFAGVDWKNLREQEPPFTPAPSDDLDTSYFEGNTLQK